MRTQTLVLAGVAGAYYRGHLTLVGPFTLARAVEVAVQIFVLAVGSVGQRV